MGFLKDLELRKKKVLFEFENKSLYRYKIQTTYVNVYYLKIYIVY